jgi:predicted AAA+ superfamily ATPase
MIKRRSAVVKGKIFEDFVAGLIKSKGIDPNAVRQIGSGSGLAKGDIRSTVNWNIECKNTKVFNWKKASEQTKKDAFGYKKECVIWHPNGVPMDQSIVIMNVHDFMDLLLKEKLAAGSDTILEQREIKYHLDQVVNHLKKVIKDL